MDSLQIGRVSSLLLAYPAHFGLAGLHNHLSQILEALPHMCTSYCFCFSRTLADTLPQAEKACHVLDHDSSWQV